MPTSACLGAEPCQIGVRSSIKSSARRRAFDDRRGRVSTINRAGEQATADSRDELRMFDPERGGTEVDPTGATNLLIKPLIPDPLAACIKEVITGKKESDGWTV